MRNAVPIAVAFFGIAMSSLMLAGAQSQATPRPLPADVADFIGRRSTCLDWSAKIRADLALGVTRQQAPLDLKCTAIDHDERALRDRYRSNGLVISALNGTWATIAVRAPLKRGPDASSLGS
jgi:hypothetical protein